MTEQQSHIVLHLFTIIHFSCCENYGYNSYYSYHVASQNVKFVNSRTELQNTLYEKLNCVLENTAMVNAVDSSYYSSLNHKCWHTKYTFRETYYKH